MLDGKINVI